MKITKEKNLIPCDLLPLFSAGQEGSCFVETKNLDGETNLKPKYIHADLQSAFSANLDHLNGVITCDKPNSKIYNFTGRIEFTQGQTEYDKHGANQICSLDNSNIMLRGMSLRNTPYIYAVALYTGIDTKIFKCNQDVRYKTSRVMQTTNRNIIKIFIFQILISAFSACIGSHWTVKN